jgi:glutathione S-transferase
VYYMRVASPSIRLYTIPGSHPCRAAMLMLRYKGLSWEERELPAGLQPMLMRVIGFRGRTVPGLKVNGRRIQTNLRIARYLEEAEPDPPLYPGARAERIEEAERFADEVLQPLARRLLLACGRRGLDGAADHGDDGRLGAILASSRGRRRIVIRVAYRFFGISDEVERLDMAALPGVLDHVDELVASGVIGGPEPNAADFQIAPSLALLDYRLELRDEVEPRPAWALVERLLPPPG